MLLYIGYFLFFAALFYVLFLLISYFKNGFGKFAPYVPTNSKVGKDVFHILSNEITQSRKPLKIVDLGSGTGSVLIPLAKAFPKCQFVGYEWDPFVLKIAKTKAKGLKNIRFEKKNYMEADLSSFDIVFTYILKSLADDVGKKLSQELKSGAFIVSRQFQLKHLKQISETKSSRFFIPTYIYQYRK